MSSPLFINSQWVKAGVQHYSQTLHLSRNHEATVSLVSLAHDPYFVTVPHKAEFKLFVLINKYGANPDPSHPSRWHIIVLKPEVESLWILHQAERGGGPCCPAAPLNTDLQRCDEGASNPFKAPLADELLVLRPGWCKETLSVSTSLCLLQSTPLLFPWKHPDAESRRLLWWNVSRRRGRTGGR